MKKSLLFSFIAAGILSTKASAQLALETFDGGVGTLPTGWVLINDGHTVSTSFTGIAGLPATLTTNAWSALHATGSASAATDLQMITTSYFTPAAIADRWLITPSFLVSSANMVIQWQDYDLNSGEYIEVKVSPTAGTTAAAFPVAIYSARAAAGGLTTHQAYIGGYSGTNVRVAFRDTTNDGWGLIIDNVKTAILPSLDLGVTSLIIPPFIQTGSSYSLTGNLHNYGVTVTNSIHLNYTVNGGAAVSSTLSGLSNPLGSNYTYTSTTPWVPSTPGNYTLKVWADNINGAGVDEAHANDTFTANLLVMDTVAPKDVMIEEFTQASCDPCANAHVNVDTVYINNMGRSEMIRYHVNFPGRDCMDTVTLAPFVQPRMTYYGVNGVPDAKVDGFDVYPGAGGLSSSVISAAAFNNSPFKITITPSYVASTSTFSFSADIHSYGPMAAGLKAYAVLVVDTLTYASNQSTESIPQTIFPQVAEAMLPSSSGTTLGAFTAGSTQTITASWVKNHAWGSNRSVWAYDSTSTGKIVVWVESDAIKYVFQAAHANVGVTSGVNAVTGNKGSFDVYPNPANNTATAALNLKSGANVKMEVYNIAGQLVYSVPAERRASGTSLIGIDLAGFASGQYVIKIAIDDEMLTKTLTVAK